MVFKNREYKIILINKIIIIIIHLHNIKLKILIKILKKNSHIQCHFLWLRRLITIAIIII